MTKNFEDALYGVVRGAGILLDTKAKLYTNSTRVRGAIRTRTQQRGKATYSIISRARGKLAVFREFGTKAHPILPRNYPVLVFPWDKAYDYIPRTADGRKVILSKVSHPGSKADNEGKGYMRPAGKDAINYIKENVITKGKVAIKADIKASFRTKT